jgi:tetratricopeptide (TPR) repeat protein
MSLNSANELDKALVIRRRALANMIETLPPEDSHIAIEHADLAADLQRSGHPNEAIAELELSLHGLEHNEVEATQRTNIEAQYGIALFNAGHHEQGLERERQALEDRLAVSGEVGETVNMRSSLIELELDAGKLETIDHDLAAQERWYRAHPDDAKIGMLVMSGEYRASVALQRHDPLDAEKRAHAAIDASAELHVRDDTRANFYELLGLSLIAQKKWADARAAIDTAQSLSRKTHQQEDAFAILDVDLAQIDLGEGHRAEARERVTRARAVLGKYLGSPRSIATADALIAELQKPR